MFPVTPALMDLQGMCWEHVSYSSRIFTCKMEVQCLFSLGTPPGMDHEGEERKVFSTPVLVQRRGVDSLPFFCFTGTFCGKTTEIPQSSSLFSTALPKNLLGSLMYSSVRVIWLRVVCQAPHPWIFSAVPSTMAAP